MARLEFTITRQGALLAHGELIEHFATEADAANAAVRFAQDQGALYRIDYQRRAA